MKTSRLFNILATIGLTSVLVAGCGGGGGGSSTSTQLDNDTTNDSTNDNTNDNTNDDTTTDTNPFAGSSSISGNISLSSLSGADAQNLNSPALPVFSQARSLARSLHDTGSNENAIVKLYVVGSDGELEDTGMDCSFTDEADDQGNPAYACDGIADGVSYVVKYVKILDDNQAIEMKVDVAVPEGSTAAAATDMSPQTTVVVDTLVSAILTATEGKSVDQEVVESIISAVKEAIVGLVASGAVQIPSMTVEAPRDDSGNYITDVNDLAEDDNVAYAENNNLSSTAGSLLSNEEIAQGIDIVKVEEEVRGLQSIDITSEAGRAALIRSVFLELLGDDDVPDFFVDFFIAKYIEDRTETIGNLFGAISAGVDFDHSLSVDLNSLGLSKSDALADFEAALDEIYSLLDKKAAGTITEEELADLAEIPGIIPGIFKQAEWQDRTLDLETVLDMPQGVTFVIYVVDEYIPNRYEEVNGEELGGVVSTEGGDGDSVNVEHGDAIDFDPMYFDPGYAETGQGNPGLMQLLGFFEQSYLDTLSGVEITELDLWPNRAWIHDEQTGHGTEYDSLSVFTCMADPASMVAGLNEQSGTDYSAYMVELTYPTSTGTDTLTMVNEAELFNDHRGEEDGEDAWFPCFAFDPWRMAEAETQSDTSSGGFVNLTLDDIVTDFTSGVYTVRVMDGAGAVVATKEFDKKVLVGMLDVRPTLTSPNGMPHWPKECEFSSGPCTQWDELMTAWQEAGGVTTFALNEDTDSDGVDDMAKITVSWEKPDVELPEGVKVAYSLDIGLNTGCDEFGCGWEHIFSTWERDQRLFTTSYTVPVRLSKNDLQSGGSYNANVCVQFVDTQTNEELGSGSCAFAEFHVGDPLDLGATFTVSGEVPDGLGEDWKVALIKEQYNVDALVNQWEKTTVLVGTISGTTYSLTPTLGDFLSGDANAHKQILLFKDADADGALDDSEMHFWPDWESNVFFDTWGGILRVVNESYSSTTGEYSRDEVIVTGGEEVSGPDFGYLAEDPCFDSFVTGTACSIDPIAEGDTTTASDQTI